MHKAAKSRGWSISFRAEGDGPPLVLLHGWSQWSAQWREYGYAGQLAAPFRVIAVDLLGHGESDRPHDPDEYAEALLVADIVAVLDAEGAGRACVWGYSLGRKLPPRSPSVTRRGSLRSCAVVSAVPGSPLTRRRNFT
jgi:pimeloyl-ACP methyl ester carboxylesterase